MAKPSIDLRPYGLNWTLDPKNVEPIPASYIMASVAETPGSLTFSLPEWPAPQVFDINDKSGQSGSYGQIWSTRTVIDNTPLVVKYMTTSAGPLTDSEIITEVLIQLIIYEQTKEKRDPDTGVIAPYCPRLFMVGKARRGYYIVMEKIDFTIKQILKHENYRPTVVKSIMCQTATILSTLYSELGFNHRDFKSDNIMCKVVGKKYVVRFVDFGFGCLTYGKTKIQGDNSYVSHCNSQSRDMNALLYYFINHGPGPSPIRSIFSVLIDYYGVRPREWKNTYTYYNTAPENPNTNPTVVFNIFKNLRCASDKWSTEIDPSWAAHIVALTPKMYERLSEAEIQQLNPEVFTRYRTTVSATVVLDMFFKAVGSKNRALIEKMYSTDKDIFTRLNGAGVNIIHYVCRMQDSLLLEFILDIYKDPTYVNSVTALLQTPLMICIEGGWLAGFERLLDHPAIDVMLCDKNKENALHFAIKHGHTTMAETLIDKYPLPQFINQQNVSNATPLNTAVYLNRLPIVRKLLFVKAINVAGSPSIYRYCVHANLFAGFRTIALHNITEIGEQIRAHPDVVQYALEVSNLDFISILITNFFTYIDSNIINRHGDTLLIVVDTIDLVNILLAKNSSAPYVNHINDDGVSALKRAILRNNEPVILRLLEVANIDLEVATPGEPNLFFALAQSSCRCQALFDRLAESHRRIDVVNTIGQTPLMIAAGRNNLWFVEAWIKLPSRYTAVRDRDGNTALHYASLLRSSNNLEQKTAVVRALLEANPALATIRNKEGLLWGLRPSSRKVAGNTTIRNLIKARLANRSRPLRNTNKNRKRNTQRTNKVVPL